MNVKFTFWAGSIKGLEHEVTVIEHTYLLAKRKVMKELYLQKEHVDSYSIIELINYWPE